MTRFSKEVNLDPKEIKNMDLSQKQDCMAEIDSRRSLAWKYSVIFCLAVMLYIALYSVGSLIYTMRYMKPVQSIHLLFFLIPIVIFIPSLLAHSMNGNAVLCAVLAYMLTGFLSIVSANLTNAWVFPFAFAGAFFYMRLSRVCETYEALSKENGFPEFCNIESMADAAREIIERNAEKEEKLHPLTELAIMSAKNEAAKEKAAEASSGGEKENAAPESINAVKEDTATDVNEKETGTSDNKTEINEDISPEAKENEEIKPDAIKPEAKPEVRKTGNNNRKKKGRKKRR